MAKGYDEFDARIRVPKGTTLDQSKNTPGARRALARDAQGNLVGQAEILGMQKSRKRPAKSPAPTESVAEVAVIAENAPDISKLVPIALVAVAGIAAGVAGVKVAQHAKKRRQAARAEMPSLAQATATPAGWYEVANDPTRLRYWNGVAWTDDYAQRAGAAPTIAADWYPDPSNAAQLRYWDGSAWTHHVAPRPGAVTTPADWYPDPSNAAQLRCWDGTAWTNHVTAGPGAAVAHQQTNAPSADKGLAPAKDEPRTNMTTAEWQAHVRGWLQAGAIQQELWRRLSNAHIKDADDATLTAQRKMEALTPEEGARQVQRMLEANPALREPGALLDFMKVFGGGGANPLGIEIGHERDR